MAGRVNVGPVTGCSCCQLRIPSQSAAGCLRCMPSQHPRYILYYEQLPTPARVLPRPASASLPALTLDSAQVHGGLDHRVIVGHIALLDRLAKVYFSLLVLQHVGHDLAAVHPDLQDGGRVGRGRRRVTEKRWRQWQQALAVQRLRAGQSCAAAAAAAGWQCSDCPVCSCTCQSGRCGKCIEAWKAWKARNQAPATDSAAASPAAPPGVPPTSCPNSPGVLCEFFHRKDVEKPE